MENAGDEECPVSVLGVRNWTRFLGWDGMKREFADSSFEQEFGCLSRVAAGRLWSVEKLADQGHGVLGALFHEPVSGAEDDLFLDVGGYVSHDGCL